MWRKYEVELQMRERIVGGIPKDPEIIEGWLKARGLQDVAEATKEEMADQITEGAWQGFKSNQHGLYIEARQVKAMLKEAANIVRHVIKFKGYMKARLAERVFIRPTRISLGVDEPTGTIERPIHVNTRMGPRDALKRCDYVEEAFIAFDMWVLDDGVLTDAHFEALFEYAGENGLGADRSQGEGQFDCVRLEEVGTFDKIG